MKTLALVGFFIGLFLLTAAPVDAAFDLPPTHIAIPTADIHLSVVEAPIAYDTWQVSFAGASFGQGTSYPGSEGNTVIFSHALPHLFGNLPSVKVGDTIHVFTTLDWFLYRVTNVQVVKPDDLSVLTYQGGRELTLYTCVGDKDEQRFIVHAALVTTQMP